ncbi:hypothetical protein SAZ10_14110 [Mesorhizobium sp. BAC0120]|uniref:hypothetical protein n=1 Tax=Mesorhizobium sp. BAC0120 TaxID=3090670 RepID=UPI00298C3DF6|nr:hypothetical protein [Mesorhizobium sp. BAC0120]MDW6022893.1 hypothetical protein [Mesorhizobium sp. BAC0120]
MVAFAAAGHAADVVEPQQPPPPGHEWTFTVAPYFWMAGLRGDTGIFGRPPAHVDESFGDIIKDFEFGGMAVMELENGTWGLLADIMYAKTDANGSVTGDVNGVPTTLSADVESSVFTGTVMGEYRLYSQPTATFDLMAGVRIWDVNADLDISVTQSGPALAGFSGSDGSTWVDPMVGLKGRYNINDKWFVNGWAMIGGFGAGSDLSWDLMGGVGYQYNNWLSFALGYRALGVDYDNDGFIYDVVQHGPILGTIMKF